MEFILYYPNESYMPLHASYQREDRGSHQKLKEAKNGSSPTVPGG